MKKILSCLLALLMTASLLAGCGQQKTDDYNSGDVTEPALADGVYTADFNTDSSMFHANETCDGKGVLTVKDGALLVVIQRKGERNHGKETSSIDDFGRLRSE